MDRENKPPRAITPTAIFTVARPKGGHSISAAGRKPQAQPAKEKPQKGTVIATGNGKHDEPMEVKAGDTVLFGKYSGTEIHIDDKKYLVMNQSDVLVIL